ncbi:hypothetical protein LDENG_00119450, partial [Lucifuga dentata]
FYTGAVESLLTGSITAWFGNTTAQDHEALSRVVRTAEKISRSSFPNITDINNKPCRTRTKIIVKDSYTTVSSNQVF